MIIVVELNEEGTKAFKELKKIAGTETDKELFDNAFTLLDWAIKQQIAGRTIASLDASNKICGEIAMPILEHITKTSKS